MKPPTEVAEPSGVVTTTSTAPAVPDGLVQVICVAESTVQVAAVPSKVTVPPVRLVPVMTTVVPPAVGPEFGTILLMVGAGLGR